MNSVLKNLKIEFTQVDQVANCLKVLANSDRLKILCVLINAELNVQQIENSTEIHQPTLSQQLTVLRNNKMVSTRRDGKQIFYALADQNVISIMQTLHEIYCQD